MGLGTFNRSLEASERKIVGNSFRKDNEAFELWKTKTDINPDHILRFAEKDNFWEMGETCTRGPCLEIILILVMILITRNM